MIFITKFIVAITVFTKYYQVDGRSYNNEALELFKPDLEEVSVTHIPNNLLEVQKLRFEKGDNFTYNLGGNMKARNHGSQFFTDDCGTVILNVPMVEMINYTINFKINNLQPNHVVCVGIASEGFLIQEVLQLNGEGGKCLSRFQKGFCSNNQRSHLYKDLYTNYNQFDESSYLDEGMFDLGEESEENIFNSDSIIMNLQGHELIFVDEEHDELLASFEKLDRSRVYLPIILIRDKKDNEYLQPIKEKRIRQFKQRNNNIDCVKPPEIDEHSESQSESSFESEEHSQIQIDDQDTQIDEAKDFSFLQVLSWVNNLVQLESTKLNLDKVSPFNELPVPPKKEEIIPSVIEIIEITSHAETTIQMNQVKPLRDNLVITESNKYLIFQQNLLLPTPLQAFESCSYAYLNVPPFTQKSNIFLQISIIQLDFTSGVYPIGFGVFATEMLDQFRGFRNAQSQIWCLEQELFQYGALYRSDGTFYDSQELGEYNKYSNKRSTNRQGTIQIFFTKGNRVIYRIGKDKRLHVTCVNSRFKQFTPIFELKSWKGQPMIRIDKYENHHTMPFDFSDSDEKLYENFGRQGSWVLLSKFYTEKRGNFDETSDDYTLICTSQSTASMNMWDTYLYFERYEWFVRIEEIELALDSPTQMCIGVHQIGQENKIEQILNKNYTSQVAYVCDKNDFSHTFFEECPIYENLITFIPGTVLRFRLSDFLMEVFDGYNTVFFSLRKAGNTAVIPSVILRGGKNSVTFLRSYQKQGPNPIEWKLKDPADLVTFQNFVSYDIFSLPKFKDAEEKKLQFCWDDSVKQKEDSKPPQDSSKDEKNTSDQKDLIQRDQKIQNDQIVMNVQSFDKDQGDQRDPIDPKGGINHQTISFKQNPYLSNTLPQEINVDQDIDKLKIEPCVTLYSFCNYTGRNVVVCGDHHEQTQLLQFQSAKLNNERLRVRLDRQNGALMETLIISSNIACLDQPISLQQTTFNFYY